MTATFELPSPRLFTAGTIGEPGQRVFFVQAAEDAVVVTLKLEKTQVAVLAQYMAELLADLPPVPDVELPHDLELIQPIVAEWVVGTIGVAFDERRDRIVVTFQELQATDALQGTEGASTDDEPQLDDDTASLATVIITRPQAMAFVRRAAELVSSGRPPCTLCGRPLDPEGHVCIKTNGHLH